MPDNSTESMGPGAAILVLEADGSILSANDSARRLLRQGDRSVEGMPLLSLLEGPGIADALSKGLQAAGNGSGMTGVLKAAGDARIEVAVSLLRIPCACGGHARTVCVIQPAGTPPTAAGQAEEPVRSADLADLLPDIVFEMDAGGTLTFVNQNAYEITGYTREDFARGLRALDIIAPEDRERAVVNIRRILAGERGEPNEYTAVRKDGSRFPVIIHSVPAFRDGRPAGLRGIMIDVTEQKRAETDLRIVDSAMASSINAIAIADMEGRLTYVNAAFLRLWGYESERDVLRRPVVDFWLAPDKGIEVVKALQRDGGWIGELVGKRRDGSVFEVETAATLVTDEGGEPIRMMASFIDVTDRKRNEEEHRRELIRREKLRGALEMAGATCHEFNQPMQVISGYAELLLRDSEESGQAAEELQRIKAASDRMIEITRKLQQITRYETREYVGGATIIDIDKSSSLTAPREPRE